MKLWKNKKNFPLHKRLFVQLYVSFSVILFAFVLVTGITYMHRFEESIVNTYKKTLKSQGRHIAKEMSLFIQKNDTEGSFAYQEYLDSMANSENTDIWFLDSGLSKTPLEKEFTNADITDVRLSKEVNTVLAKAKNGKVAYASGYDGIYEKTMMCVAAPLYNSKQEVVGIVLLNSFVEQRDATIAASRRYLICSLVAGGLIALLLSWILARVITKPLSRMRQITRELAEGNYEKRTNIKVYNEIGILAQGMDMLAQRLGENEKERKSMEQARLDFFSNVSHELRTPITVMRGYSESLADGVVKEEKKSDYYQRMITECKSMERLVGDLLTLSKMQNPHFVIEKEPVNLVQVFQDILRGLQASEQENHIEFVFSYATEVILMLGDYERLRQLFSNILNNAVKFSSPGGHIWVTITDGEEICVTVRDEGVGISEEDLPNIFDKFYKSKLRQNAKGSGLGLVIAKYIVEKHQGRIEVESGLGEGTSFRFYFQAFHGEWE